MVTLADWFSDPDAICAWLMLAVALLVIVCTSQDVRRRQWEALRRRDGGE